MLTSIISNTGWCHSVGVFCNFMDTFVVLGNFVMFWQMLLPCCLVCVGCCNHQIDVITCCFYGDRCCCHKAGVVACCLLSVLTDVFATFVVAEGIATVLLWYLLEWQMWCLVGDVVTTFVIVAF